MKERKKFIEEVKQLYSQHKNAIQTMMVIIAGIVIFAIGYLFSWNFMEKPLDETQFELCEQVARNVYAQKGEFIVEVPEDFVVNINSTTITVQSSDKFYRGKVLAKLQNGELVMTHDMETGEAIVTSILMGTLFLLLSVLIIAIILEIYGKVKK